MYSKFKLITTLFLITSGVVKSQNYFAGTNAGAGNTGFSTTGVGYFTLSNNNSASGGCGFGYLTLRDNSTGNFNTAFGATALQRNTSGNGNSAVGGSALFFNTIGNYNCALGQGALTNNTTAWNNNAVGYLALSNNTTAWNNNAFGWKCLYTNTVGEENAAFGHDAMWSNDSGSYNSAFGNYALFSNTKGINNCSFGTYSLNNNSTGNNNVAVGYNAGALKAIYNKCTLIGANADATASNYTNATALGYGAKVSGSNKVRIGNTAVTSIGGQVGWTTLSDLRLKNNISDSELGLDFILRLHPVTYNYKDEDQRDILYTGLIAQEVDAAAKKEGFDFSGVDKNGEYWGIRYGDLTVPLIKAVQEMNADLKIKNEKLENEIAAIKEVLTDEQFRKLNSIQGHENKLEQNQPNPFNKQTTINYHLNPGDINARIIIRDLNGNLVKQMNITQSGKGRVTINANELAQGTYTYTLEVNGTSVDTKLMVLVK